MHRIECRNLPFVGGEAEFWWMVISEAQWAIVLKHVGCESDAPCRQWKKCAGVDFDAPVTGPPFDLKAESVYAYVCRLIAE